jgi:SAM-dependent methyltransferase
MSETFQITVDAAESYEANFVPAFFAQWVPALCAAAAVGPGQRVLDVGCGTGIVARTAADLVAPGGTVTGVDLNEAMLTVARRVRGDLDWRQGDASALPFGDGSFDVVLSQMMLMFVDAEAALGEMARVAATGGVVGILVPSDLGRQPAFSSFVDVAAVHAGPDAVSLLGSYFACGDLDALAELAASAGLRVTAADRVEGTYSAPSVDAAVTTEIESTPLRERIGDDVYDRIRAGARTAWRPYTAPDGSLHAPFECNLVVARR